MDTPSGASIRAIGWNKDVYRRCSWGEWSVRWRGPLYHSNGFDAVNRKQHGADSLLVDWCGRGMEKETERTYIRLTLRT